MILGVVIISEDQSGLDRSRGWLIVPCVHSPNPVPCPVDSGRCTGFIVVVNEGAVRLVRDGDLLWLYIGG